LHLAEEHFVFHHRPPHYTGIEVAAVTSMVLTNSAARQVDTVLNSSAVIVFSFPEAVNRREFSLDRRSIRRLFGSTVAARRSTSERCADERSSSFDECPRGHPSSLYD